MKTCNSLLSALLIFTILAGCQGSSKSSGSLQPAPENFPRAEARMPPISGDQRFVIISDTQYPRTEESDGDTEGSGQLIRAQIAAVKAYRNANGGLQNVPLFLNGDITEYGHGWQWEAMRGLLTEMSPVYYGLGNHDYDNNIRLPSGQGCYNNGCAHDSLSWFKDDVQGWGVDAFDQRETGEGNALRQDYYGSYSYSKTIGNFKFIQLNNHYNFTVNFSTFQNFERKTYHITSSLDWLEAQLKQAMSSKKFVVINMHRPPGDSTMGSQADRDRFDRLVNEYNVVAIFHGHSHVSARDDNIGQVPVFDSGAAFKKTFLVAEYSGENGQFRVQQANDNTIDTTLANIELLKSSAVPAPTVNQVAPGSTTFTFNQPTGLFDRRLREFLISLNGGPEQRVDGNSINFSDLTPSTYYTYRVNAIDSKGERSPQPYQGEFYTLPAGKAPKNLCLYFHGDYLAVRWEPAEPDYWPMPFYFFVALVDHSNTSHIKEIIRGSQQDSRTYTQIIDPYIKGKTPEQIKGLSLGIAYIVGRGTGQTWNYLPLRWMYGNAQEKSKLYCPGVAIPTQPPVR